MMNTDQYGAMMGCDCEGCEDIRRSARRMDSIPNTEKAPTMDEKGVKVMPSNSPMYQYSIIKHMSISELLARYRQLSIKFSKDETISYRDKEEREEIEKMMTAALENYLIQGIQLGR